MTLTSHLRIEHPTDEVVPKLTVSNPGSDPVELSFTSGQHVDFAVCATMRTSGA